MNRFEPLRSDTVRFALSYLLVFATSMLALGYLSYQSVEQSLEDQLRHRITAETAQLLGDYRDDGLGELRHDIHERLEATPVNRLRYSIRGPGGRTIFDRLSDEQLSAGWHRRTLEDGSDVLLFVEMLEDGYALTVGADLEPVNNLGQAMRQRVGVFFALTLLLGIVGGVVLVRRFRRRLEQFSEAAARVGRGSLAQRLEVPSGDRELDALGNIINDMLGRIEELVRNARRVTSNIAHDLRTPLSRLRTQLESLRDNGSASREELEAAIEQLDDCLQTFSALLRIAEIESGAQRRGFGQVLLEPLIERLCDVYRPLADSSRIELVCTVEPGAALLGDEEMLGQALANLVENALKHSAASRVHMEAFSRGGALELRVSDDGVGVPVEERSRVLEPFHRLDASRSTPGNGLGLSLVRAVAQLHDAKLSLKDNDPGLVVRMVFR